MSSDKDQQFSLNHKQQKVICKMPNINIFLFVLRRFNNLDVHELSNIIGLREEEISAIEDNRVTVTDTIIKSYSINLSFPDRYFLFFLRKNKIYALFSKVLLTIFLRIDLASIEQGENEDDVKKIKRNIKLLQYR